MTLLPRPFLFKTTRCCFECKSRIVDRFFATVRWMLCALLVCGYGVCTLPVVSLGCEVSLYGISVLVFDVIVKTIDWYAGFV